MPRPVYPEMARRARIFGKVNVEVTIDEKGQVISARPVSGPSMLRGAAADAARLARFNPLLYAGRPVQATGVIIYNFVE